MAYLDTIDFDRKETIPVAWEGLAVQLDVARSRALAAAAPIPAPPELGFVRQMLLAAAMAAGGILAVAGVMLLRFV